MEERQSWELPHISQAVPLTEADKMLVEELVTVLRKHDALKRFGLTLLHQHFTIGDDEVLCEDVDVTTRTLTTGPVNTAELQSVPHKVTAWRLDTGRPMMGCVCKDYGGGHQHFPYPG